MKTKKCQHDRVRQVGEPSCFSASVAVHPYTGENRAAHGNIEVTEECVACGAQRQVNINQWHHEYGPFGPSRAEREADEQHRLVAARRAKEAMEDAALQARKAEVIEVRERPGYHTQVLISVDGVERWIPLWEVRESAKQHDNGDGLVPFYRGLLRAIREHNKSVSEIY